MTPPEGPSALGVAEAELSRQVVEPLPQVVVEVHIDSGERRVELLWTARADYGARHGRLREHPCNGERRQRHARLGGDRLQAVDGVEHPLVPVARLVGL